MNRQVNLQELQAELEQDKLDCIKWKKYLNEVHLGKFKDIDLFLQKTNKEIKEYFKSQKQFDKIEDFIVFLKGEIQFYINSYSLERKEKRLIRDRLIHIEETYDELIYFGEFNPVKARREKIKAEEEASLHPDIQAATSWMKRMLDGILK